MVEWEIRQGDCRELLRAMPAESVHCVVTSPPYNVGLDYGTAVDDASPWADYESLASVVVAQTARLLVEGGRVWINVAPVVPVTPLAPGDHSGRCYKPRLSLLGVWMRALEASGLELWDIICWPTPGRGPGTAWGSWASPSAPNLRGEWEAILVGYKGTWGRRTPAAFTNWKDDLGGWTALVSNVWKMQPVPRDPGRHPAPFPLELALNAIRLSTWPGEMVLDPFAGSGTTLRAAKDLGRHAIGLEIEERFCAEARARLAQASMFTVEAVASQSAAQLSMLAAGPEEA